MTWQMSEICIDLSCDGNNWRIIGNGCV